MASRTPSRLALLLLIIIQAWQWLIPRKKPHNPHTIWVIHQLLLGDTIMLTGLLAKLRQNYPQATIIMLGNPAFETLYASQPYGVQYWAYNVRSIRSLLQLFTLPRPDWALIPGDNRYGWLAFVRGAKWLIGFTGDRPAYKQICFDELLALPKHPIAVSDMMQQLCSGKNAPPYQAAHWLFNTQATLPRLAAINTNTSLSNSSDNQIPAQPFILFHIGAKSAIKHWSTQKWLALARYFKQHNKQVVLSAAQGETAQLDAINQVLNLPSYRANLDLMQLIKVMQTAQLIICLDNGIGQLAKVIATPTVCLFGAGSTTLFAEAYFWQKSPYQSVTTAMECRNTSLLFKRNIAWIQTCNRSVQNCLHPTPICMENISVEQVIQAAHAQLPCLNN